MFLDGSTAPQYSCTCTFSNSAAPAASDSSATTDATALMQLMSSGALGEYPSGIGALDFSSGSALVKSLFSNPVYLLILGGLGWWGYAKITEAQEKAIRRARAAAIRDLEDEYGARRKAIEERFPTRAQRRQAARE